MRLLVATFFLLSLLNCRKESEFSIPCTGVCSQEWQLEGTWHWLYTQGLGADANARDVDYTRRIIITGNKWREYYNDSLTRESIIEFQTNPDTSTTGSVMFDNRHDLHLNLNRYGLELGGGFEDSPVSWYCKE